MPAPARLVDSQPSIQEPQCRASPPTSKYFPSAPPWCWGLRCSQGRSTERPSCCRRKVMNRRQLWPKNKTKVPAAPTTRRTWLPDSNRGQRSPRTLKTARTLAMAPIPPQPTPATTPPRAVPPPPSTRWKTPISTAPAAYISAAFPTTPATPTLPFVPTARTRSARRHSHSMNTSALQKRVALRSSPSSTAWAAPAKRSPAWAPNHSVKASAAISRASILPVGTSSATTLFRARASTTAATLSPGRSRRKRQPQESPHRHALSQRDRHAAV